MQASILPLGQQEAISDCSFDFYGLRLASCGLDAKIRLFRLNESNGEWASESEWKAHEAPVARVSWAHPEHGALIASCSFDRTVKVWQEAERASGSLQSPRWVERAVLTEAKGSVRDVAFAPAHFGLKLATIATDSMLRIYECLEIYNASSWQLTEELDVMSFGGITPSLTPAIPTPGVENGSPASSDGLTRRPSTPSITQASKLAASASSREAESGWCLSWCKEKWWGEVVAVSAGTSACVKVIALPPAPNRPVLLISLDHRPPEKIQPQAITSLSWAPMCGRSYHLLATGSRDTLVRVWKLKPNANATSIAVADGEHKWTSALVGEFGDHKSSVGRVEWNVTGTVLSSAGDDGQIRFWKALSNVWRKIGSFNTHHVAENDAAGDEDAVMS